MAQPQQQHRGIPEGANRPGIPEGPTTRPANVSATPQHVAPPPGAKVQGTVAANAVDGKKLTSTEFRDLIGRGCTNFSGCTIEKAPICGRNLPGASFVCCVMHKADMRTISATQVNFQGTDFTGSDFTGAVLTGANLCDCDLRGCDFTGASLKAAQLTGAKIDATTKIDGALRHKTDAQIPGWSSATGRLRKAS